MNKRKMLRVEIACVLIFVICIYTSTIGITTADEIDCPDTCECTRNESTQAIDVKCFKEFKGSYTGWNIENFTLTTYSALTLGPHEFHENGLDSPKSIIIKSRLKTDQHYRGQLSIHPDIFQNNSQLDVLKIEKFEHIMNDCDATRDYFFDAQSVRKLGLSFFEYKCWSSLSFSKIPNLQYLTLEIPTFKIIPDIFKPLHNLIHLEMFGMNHLDIQLNTFDGINLKELFIVDSVIESLANFRIIGLQYLYLENNSMTHIRENDFLGLSELTTLIIKRNIETIHNDAFIPLSHLKNLDIQYNKIVSLTDYHLRENFALETLSMAFNYVMNYLPIFKLNSTHKSYRIYKLHCHSCGLIAIHNGTFDAMPKLTKIDLYENRLKELPKGFFKELSSLKVLRLDRNFIKIIPNDMFKGAIGLEDLYLGENPLTTLTMAPFSETPKLKKLDVSKCRIKTWVVHTKPLNSLRYLSIYDNKLEHIIVDHLKTVPHLLEFAALDNPIKCDSVLDTLITWAIPQNITIQFLVSTSNFCRPHLDSNTTCWNRFRDIICNSKYKLDLKPIKKADQEKNWKHITMFNNQLSEAKIHQDNTTTEIASLTNKPEYPFTNQSLPSNDNSITDTTSLGDILDVQGDKSARETISFFVIIFTLVVTTLIT